MSKIYKFKKIKYFFLKQKIIYNKKALLMENEKEYKIDNQCIIGEQSRIKNDSSTNYESEDSRTLGHSHNSSLNDSLKSNSKKMTIDDFYLSFIIGKGTYAKVVLAKHLFTNKYYAVKILDKNFLIKVSSIYIFGYKMSEYLTILLAYYFFSFQIFFIKS